MPAGFLEPHIVVQMPSRDDVTLAVRLCCVDYVAYVDVREFSDAQQKWLMGFWLPADQRVLGMLAQVLADAATDLAAGIDAGSV
jgi:hypothetical protein